ncbi:MAG TPA: hypothetical protein VHM20_03445, partial [Gammaproteobacteria bacterium]|nr:hypothetical protein [Gammaproteobacteria bacterium]
MYEFIVRKSRLDAHQLNPMMGYDTKAIRILNSEMLGGLNNKSALNRNEVRSNIALSMLKEAFLYSPSIIGKKFYWSEFIPVGLDGEESDDESSDDDSVGETYGLPNHIDEGSSLDFVSKPPEEEVEANEKLFAHYTLRNPIKVILQIAWPNSWKDVFRGWADFLFPLRIADVLFYGVTTCLEAAFRGLGKLLLMPFNYLLINPLKKAIMGYDVSGWSLLG